MAKEKTTAGLEPQASPCKQDVCRIVACNGGRVTNTNERKYRRIQVGGTEISQVFLAKEDGPFPLPESCNTPELDAWRRKWVNVRTSARQ